MPKAYGIGGLISVPPGALSGEGAPPATYKGVLGQQYFDKSTSPPSEYVFNGETWEAGGNAYATDTTPGIIRIATDAEAILGTSTTLAMTPHTVGLIAIAGAPDATEITKGIAMLATQIETNTGTDDTKIVTPLKLANFVGSGGFAGSFTDLTATGTVSFTGATGAYTITSATASSVGTTGAGVDLTLSSAAGRVVVNGEEAAADAVRVLSAAGGLDVDVALLASITSSRNNAQAILIEASAGGIDIFATGAATEDIDIVNTGGSVNISATENAADSITIVSTAGGIDITAAGAATEDIDIVNTAGSIKLNAGEAVSDAIDIDSTGGIDIDAAGQVNIASSQNAGDSIVITSSAGGIDILATGAAAGEDIDITASSSINISSTENAALAITLNTNGGTSETIRVRNQQGTGAASIELNSTAGGITVAGGLGTADAVNITASTAGGGIDIDASTGGVIVDTTGAISLDSATASNFTVTGAFDLSLISTLGSVNVTAGEDAADAIVISAGAGGIDILATGAAGQDIDIVNTGGSVNVAATENDAGAITIGTNGGTSERITVTCSQGTNAASIGLVSTSGGVTISGGLNTADAINIVSSNAAGGIDIDAGTNGFIVDSTGAFSIDGAAASNVTTTGAGIDLTLSSVLGSVLVSSTEDAALAIRLHANGGTSETIQIHSDQGTGVSSIGLLSDVGGITLRATGLASADAINLEAPAGGLDVDVALQMNLTSSQAAASAIVINASNAAGGIDLTTGGGSVDISSAGFATVVAGTDTQASPSATATINTNVGRATFTGFTTAAAGTQTFVITNSIVTTSSCVLVTVCNEGANDAQMNITRITRGAGSLSVATVNSGAAALNGNVAVNFWVLTA